MAIKLENINYKLDDKVIFKDLNLVIPYNKIIGMYGNKIDEFKDFLQDKNFNTGKIVDDDYYLKNVSIIDYDNFFTNYVKDELSLRIKFANELEDISDILDKFSIDETFLEKTISSLSSFEKKLLLVIISMFDQNKVIVFYHLFNGLDYHNKSLLVRVLKNIKKHYGKIIFIYDYDMDTINNLVDKILIIDDELVLLDNIEDVFSHEKIDKIDIETPNFIKINKMLKEKGVNIENINSINDLLRK